MKKTAIESIQEYMEISVLNADFHISNILYKWELPIGGDRVYLDDNIIPIKLIKKYFKDKYGITKFHVFSSHGIYYPIVKNGKIQIGYCKNNDSDIAFIQALYRNILEDAACLYNKKEIREDMMKKLCPFK